MARLARVVVPGVPHHVTQRGNRRQATFFNEEDYAAYLALLGEWCGRCGVAVWAYCLMPNHVHLIVVPESEDGLRRGLGEAHRRYTRRINFREGWRGHLWQGFSTPRGSRNSSTVKPTASMSGYAPRVRGWHFVQPDGGRRVSHAAAFRGITVAPAHRASASVPAAHSSVTSVGSSIARIMAAGPVFGCRHRGFLTP